MAQRQRCATVEHGNLTADLPVVKPGDSGVSDARRVLTEQMNVRVEDGRTFDAQQLC